MTSVDVINDIIHFVKLHLLFLQKLKVYIWKKEKVFCQPPARLEPAIPGLGGRCLIHWATVADITHYYGYILRIDNDQ